MCTLRYNDQQLQYWHNADKWIVVLQKNFLSVTSQSASQPETCQAGVFRGKIWYDRTFLNFARVNIYELLIVADSTFSDFTLNESRLFSSLFQKMQFQFLNTALRLKRCNERKCLFRNNFFLFVFISNKLVKCLARRSSSKRQQKSENLFLNTTSAFTLCGVSRESSFLMTILCTFDATCMMAAVLARLSLLTRQLRRFFAGEFSVSRRQNPRRRSAAQREFKDEPKQLIVVHSHSP